MVVDTARSPEPPRRSSNTARAGWPVECRAETDPPGDGAAQGLPPPVEVLLRPGEPSARRRRRAAGPCRGPRRTPGRPGRAGRAGRPAGAGHLLDLVGRVAGLDLGAEPGALDRLGQDHRGRPLVGDGGGVGGVELAAVVAAPGQGEQGLVVGQVLDHRSRPGVGAEEVLPGVGPALHRVLLELAVEGGVHAVDQHAVDVGGQHVVPPGAPDDLDHVPARAPEHRLQLLDDLAVAPHRPVEALQVAVDDEDRGCRGPPGPRGTGRRVSRARRTRRRPGSTTRATRWCRRCPGGPGSG